VFRPSVSYRRCSSMLNYAFHYDLGLVTMPSKKDRAKNLGVDIHEAQDYPSSFLKQRQALEHPSLI
jgi:hypothetical protein